MKRVSFLLPTMAGVPVGGFKVVYEYANRLVQDGYCLAIVYSIGPSFGSASSVRGGLLAGRNLLRSLYHIFRGWHRRCPWFDLDERIQCHAVWDLTEGRVPSSDIYVATAATTAAFLRDYVRVPPANKFYFIQSYENWSMSEAELLETYRYPLRKIVIGNWLKKMVERTGESAVQIPNGFDFSYFKRVVPAHDRNPYRVAMLYHPAAYKGCKVGFKALARVRERIPQLEVDLFGGANPKEKLPEWIHFHRTPSRELHNRIYNEAAIFLGTSFQEGWGLPVGEAMICGAAVVCTDNGGYAEMAKDRQTALVVPVGDAEAMAEKIVELMQDNDLRVRLADAGHDYIRQFTWERSIRLLEQEFSTAQDVVD